MKRLAISMAVTAVALAACTSRGRGGESPSGVSNTSLPRGRDEREEV